VDRCAARSVFVEEKFLDEKSRKEIEDDDFAFTEKRPGIPENSPCRRPSLTNRSFIDGQTIATRFARSGRAGGGSDAAEVQRTSVWDGGRLWQRRKVRRRGARRFLLAIRKGTAKEEQLRRIRARGAAKKIREEACGCPRKGQSRNGSRTFSTQAAAMQEEMERTRCSAHRRRRRRLRSAFKTSEGCRQVRAGRAVSDTPIRPESAIVGGRAG